MIDRYFSGIGSRDTPDVVIRSMKEIGKFLLPYFILRSGGAGGADSAFESVAQDRKQIFLPYDGFNGRKVDNVHYFNFTSEAMKMAAKYHPAWSKCGFAAKRFHARNCHQVLGLDLRTPVEFVVAYTEGGKLVGGTAQAIRVAKDHDIPVFNLGKMSMTDVLYFLQDYVK